MLRPVKFAVPAVSVNRPVKVVAAVLLLSVMFPVPLMVVVLVTPNVLEVLTNRVPADTARAPATDTAPVVLRVSPPVPLTVSAPRKATPAVPLIVVPPAPLNVNAPVPVIEILFEDHEMAVVAVITLAVAEANVAFGTLKVPAVYTMPALKMQLAVLNAERFSVPAVRVTAPVKVVVVVLLLSVNEPLIVVVPVTENVPVVLTNIVAVAFDNLRLPVRDEFPLLNVNEEVAVFNVTLAAASGPPDTVTPAPAPIVNVPVPTNPPVPVKFIATVGVKVPVALAVGHVNVDPAAFVNPPLNIKLAAVVTAVELNVPLFVSKEVKVVTPEFVIVKPLLALTVKAVANVMLLVPAIVNVPVVTVTAPAKLVNAALAVILCVALIVTAPVPVLLNVPLLEIPPENIYGELKVVENVPEPLMVTNPVNVFVPVVLPSVSVPPVETSVVPPTERFRVRGSKVPSTRRLTPAPKVQVAVSPL